GRELRHRRHAGGRRRRGHPHPAPCARAGRALDRGDPDRLPREPQVLDEPVRDGRAARLRAGRLDCLQEHSDADHAGASAPWGGESDMERTETIQKLYVDGEWYETGETADITSPYDGSV